MVDFFLTHKCYIMFYFICAAVHLTIPGGIPLLLKVSSLFMLYGSFSMSSVEVEVMDAIYIVSLSD